ncbi:hypothetical protein PVK06_034093 [Gossypium arboreum]|uniref:Uncharacterized protein n=1 Tax=Gossypium arboreum TaxID=29729 RepID=A0ABR0ND98_GOSAR|nr:hypothetical protein PVK06_034093 [Gossypium arboreum]
MKIDRLGAKGLLQLGMCWKIGMGTRILIWNEAWVPNLENYELQRNAMGQNLRLVSELINQNSRKWNEDAWRGKATGEYSVRSGYKLLLKESTNLVPNLYQNSSKQELEEVKVISPVKRTQSER